MHDAAPLTLNPGDKVEFYLYRPPFHQSRKWWVKVTNESGVVREDREATPEEVEAIKRLRKK